MSRTFASHNPSATPNAPQNSRYAGAKVGPLKKKRSREGKELPTALTEHTEASPIHVINMIFQRADQHDHTSTKKQKKRKLDASQLPKYWPKIQQLERHYQHINSAGSTAGEEIHVIAALEILQGFEEPLIKRSEPYYQPSLFSPRVYREMLTRLLSFEHNYFSTLLMREAHVLAKRFANVVLYQPLLNATVSTEYKKHSFIASGKLSEENRQQFAYLVVSIITGIFKDSSPDLITILKSWPNTSYLVQMDPGLQAASELTHQFALQINTIQALSLHPTFNQLLSPPHQPTSAAHSTNSDSGLDEPNIDILDSATPDNVGWGYDCKDFTQLYQGANPIASNHLLHSPENTNAEAGSEFFQASHSSAPSILGNLEP